ncbi:hypothetical protein IFM89_011985 [Coptis chinensis]|uniref:Uncharacterized protein n=1 Tax=Coptis chinensis TaxID=261450 RepID=A0A835I9P0_9MAGN|nr:hypothetical protein IFM89_011985 [Coptis chinensis]
MYCFLDNFVVHLCAWFLMAFSHQFLEGLVLFPGAFGCGKQLLVKLFLKRVCLFIHLCCIWRFELLEILRDLPSSHCTLCSYGFPSTNNDIAHDGREESVMKRTTLVANTSNMSNIFAERPPYI